MPTNHHATSHLPLFTFGTLRRSECNHSLLLGRYDRWMPATLPGFRLSTASHGFAVVVEDPGESVVGELFFLCDDLYGETLRRCDDLEDISPGETVGPYYCRVQRVVTTTEGQHAAWVYADPSTPAT
jgi:gamma-glutamylcyclotransferase (GGCT)/AIG2-like uncharacterized protein YtfP